MNDGQILAQSANECYRKRKSEKLGRSVYGGIEWGAAVAKAMQQRPKEGRRKDRRQAAEELTAKIFDKARGSSVDRLNRVAACVGPDSQMLATASGIQSELEVMANEIMSEISRDDVHQLAQGTDTADLISGMFDITMIINLIMSIITAIRACKNPAPTPTPTPAPV